MTRAPYGDTFESPEHDGAPVQGRWSAPNDGLAFYVTLARRGRQFLKIRLTGVSGLSYIRKVRL